MKRSKPINLSSVRKLPQRKRQTVTELRALQRFMAGAVMRPLTAGLRMRSRWSDGRATAEVAAGFIKPSKRLTAAERLEIYNRQYWLRVLECFHEDFPGLRAVLGEEAFRDLAVAYLANHPSTRFTLRELGRHIVDFIEAEPRWVGSRLELARDMARLEWAHIEAFDGEAKTALDLGDLEGRDPARLRLGLQPYVTLLKLGYRLDAYLIALRKRSSAEAGNEGENAPEAARLSEPHSDARPGGPVKRLAKRGIVYLVVHRHRNLVYYKRVNSAQYGLLAAIQGGESLQGALGSLPVSGRVPPIKKWFKQWAALGWFWLRG